LATWQGFALGSKWLQNGPVFPGFFCFLRVRAARCGNLLRCFLRCFFDPLCNRCVGFCVVLIHPAKRLAGAAPVGKDGGCSCSELNHDAPDITLQLK